MNLIIRSAKVVDPSSPHHGKKVDIFIKKGKIEKIGKNLKESGTKTFEAKNLHISPGWFDMQSHFTDPGQEYKEDLITGLNAAAKGGFTAVLAMPSTEPVIDNKSQIEYLINKSKSHAVNLYPSGALSKGTDGKEISEMYDMHMAGAKAFTDDKHPVGNASLLIKALLYLQSFEGLVISFPQDENLSGGGQINEGSVSTELGLRGIPSLAESLSVSRDIYLAGYCKGKLHLSGITTGESVKLIKEGKSDNNKLSCAVCAHNLFFSDESLKDYDTNLKLNPPLRDKKEIKELLKGLKSGTIDVICSDHRPEDVEEKKREFDHAAFGALSLQTAFGASRRATNKKLELEELIEKICHNPRKILGLPLPEIKEGAEAEITLFDPDMEWQPEESSIVSKSKNSPYIGQKLTGKPLAIISKNKLVKND